MIVTHALAAVAAGAVLTFQSWGYMVPHKNPLDSLILINKVYRAPNAPIALRLPDVEPVEETIRGNTYMVPKAAQALEEMFAEAASQGIHFYTRSGYRSYQTQKTIYERKDREGRYSSVAKAGYSEHQSGYAMDVEGQSTLGKGLVEAIGSSPEGIWLAEHCHEFGFILRYPKDKQSITGYIYEPWHIRYVGREDAVRIHEQDVTLEEYLTKLRRDRIASLEVDKEQ